MESKDISEQGDLHVKLASLDQFKAVTAPRTSKKRKDHPIQIKYESTDLNKTSKSQERDPTLDNRGNFVYIFNQIKEMRKDRTAPVDSMGCHMCPDEGASKETWNFQLLCSLILSVQSKDEATFKAMQSLRKYGLSVESVNKMDEAKVLELIGGVNFNRTKAKNIKAAASRIAEKHDGKVPADWKALLEFPGVGNKIAVLYLNTAHHMNVGICVDTHVHRISNRLGWVKTKLPDQTRVELEGFVPKEYWSDVNHWMVGFGQQKCQPQNPKCETCLLNDICPEGKKKMRGLRGGKKEELELEMGVKKVKTNAVAEEEKFEGEKIEIKVRKSQRNEARKEKDLADIEDEMETKVVKKIVVKGKKSS